MSEITTAQKRYSFTSVKDFDGKIGAISTWGEDKGKPYEVDFGYEILRAEPDEEMFLMEDQSVKVQCVEYSGGGEGGSQDCRSILKIGDQFFSVHYSYFSYDGFDYSYAAVFEVQPFEKIVTDYKLV